MLNVKMSLKKIKGLEVNVQDKFNQKNIEFLKRSIVTFR